MLQFKAFTVFTLLYTHHGIALFPVLRQKHLSPEVFLLLRLRLDLTAENNVSLSVGYSSIAGLASTEESLTWDCKEHKSSI